MQFIKENWHRIMLVVFSAVIPAVSFAVDTVSGQPSDTQGKIINPINSKTIQDFIVVLLKGLLKIGIPIVVLAIIYCGFLFVSARGKPEAITKAKDALLYTLIGAAILLGSWAIAEMISATVIGIAK